MRLLFTRRRRPPLPDLTPASSRVRYSCVIVCVFLRKIASSRSRDPQHFAGDAAPPELPPPPPSRRGVSQELLDTLPRQRWADTSKRKRVVDCGGGESRRDGGGIELAPIGDGTTAGDGGVVGDLEVGSDGGDDGDASTGGGNAGGPAGGSSARSEDTDGEAEVCAICHEAYAADDLLIELPCAHLFDEPCITRWLKREDFEASCPFRCRVPLLVREA